MMQDVISNLTLSAMLDQSVICAEYFTPVCFQSMICSQWRR